MKKEKVSKPRQITCTTCNDTGVYHTGAYVGDDEFDLRAIVTRCPDCDAVPATSKIRTSS